MTYRWLFTGSREASPEDSQKIFDLLREELIESVLLDNKIILVHGGAIGADQYADAAWRTLMTAFPLALEPEVHWASNFTNPLERNRYMVWLGADKCFAYAREWASGTGHCARLARGAGIETVDWGVDTS